MIQALQEESELENDILPNAYIMQNSQQSGRNSNVLPNASVQQEVDTHIHHVERLWGARIKSSIPKSSRYSVFKHAIILAPGTNLKVFF